MASHSIAADEWIVETPLARYKAMPLLLWFPPKEGVRGGERWASPVRGCVRVGVLVVMVPFVSLGSAGCVAFLDSLHVNTKTASECITSLLTEYDLQS